MLEHEMAIEKLEGLLDRLNKPGLTGGEPQRILKELVDEAIAVRRYLKKEIDGGSF